MEESENTLSIPLDREKLMRDLFTAIGVLIFGLLFIFRILNKNDQFLLLGYFFILFSVISAFYALKRLIIKKPGLIIDSARIQGFFGTFNCGPVLWSDITKVRIKRLLWQRTIVFVVNDPQTFINNQRKWFKKLKMSVNDVFFNSPFCLNTNELKISLDELFRKITSNPKFDKGN